MSDTSPVIIVTGTGTEVGKTITTAAMVVGAARAGPADRGGQGHPDRAAARASRATWTTSAASAGEVETHELLRLPDPLAPDAAARRVGVHAADGGRARRHDRRAGRPRGPGPGAASRAPAGCSCGWTGGAARIADLGAELRRPRGACRVRAWSPTPGLGTLNHSALTAEALRHRGLDCIGFVIGSWPQARTSPTSRCELNLEDLPAVTGAALLGRVPDGAGRTTASGSGPRPPPG